MAVSLLLGAIIVLWVAFGCLYFKKRYSWTIIAGGGFVSAAFVACFGGYLCAGVVAISASCCSADDFRSALEQLKFLGFWIAADVVLFALYGLLVAAVARIPIIGAVVAPLIFMPIFHAFYAIFFSLLGFGMTERHALIGVGSLLLVFLIWVAWQIALDSVGRYTY